MRLVFGSLFLDFMCLIEFLKWFVRIIFGFLNLVCSKLIYIKGGLFLFLLVLLFLCLILGFWYFVNNLL